MYTFVPDYKAIDKVCKMPYLKSTLIASSSSPSGTSQKAGQLKKQAIKEVDLLCRALSQSSWLELPDSFRECFNNSFSSYVAFQLDE